MTNKEAIKILKTDDCYECTFGGYANNCKVIGCEVHKAIDKAIEALELADEVEEASKRIGSRYYGPDTCNKCAHRNGLMSTGREEPSIFCEHWKLKVNSFDHCSNFEEVKHGN